MKIYKPLNPIFLMPNPFASLRSFSPFLAQPKKAISAVVATVLLLMMTVSAAGIAYVWTGGIQSGVQEGTTEQAETIQTQASTCMKVENVEGRTVYLRNCGNGVITANALLTYIDGLPANGTLTSEISPNNVGTLVLSGIWNLSYGNHKIRVTNGIADITKNVVAEVRKDGLVGYWRFDEGGGKSASDASEYNNMGTLGDGTCQPGSGTCPSWTAGKVGGGLQFDGTDDYTSISGSGSLKDVTDASFTFDAWVKPAAIPNGGVPAPGPDYSAQAYGVLIRQGYHLGLYYRYDQKYFATIYNDVPSSFSLGSAVIAPGTWVHLTMSVDDTNKLLYFYVNGVPVSGSPKPYTGPLRDYGTYAYNVGVASLTGNYKYYLNGVIDEVRIYNKALTPDDAINLKPI